MKIIDLVFKYINPLSAEHFLKMTKNLMKKKRIC